FGSERVQRVKNALRGGVSQGFGGAASSLDRVSRALAIHQGQPPVFAYREAGDSVVSAIGCKQKAPVLAEDDATRALESVRRAFLPADRLENARPRAASSGALHFRNCSVR